MSGLSVVIGQNSALQYGEGGSIGNWVSPKGKISPFIGGRGFYRIPAFLDSRHQIPSNTLDCLFPSNNFLPRTYYFFQISQPAKNWLKNKYFQEQIQWVPLRRLYRRLQCKDKYSISEFGKGLAYAPVGRESSKWCAGVWQV